METEVARGRTCPGEDGQPGRRDTAGQILVLGNSLAGYAETKSGRLVAFMIADRERPDLHFPEAFVTITNDQARTVVAIQQDL